MSEHCNVKIWNDYTINPNELEEESNLKNNFKKLFIKKLFFFIILLQILYIWYINMI